MHRAVAAGVDAAPAEAQVQAPEQEQVLALLQPGRRHRASPPQAVAVDVAVAADGVARGLRMARRLDFQTAP